MDKPTVIGGASFEGDTFGGSDDCTGALLQCTFSPEHDRYAGGAPSSARPPGNPLPYSA